jgi:3-hydroxyacyl-[acyl-carrier-protein] dehydratase
MAESAALGPLDVKRVMAALPHRYPMLLVDRVESIEPDRSIVAVKAVTSNEGFFQGHFPGRPIMPGVLIVEALAQAAGILAFVPADVVPDESTRFFFVGIDKARFRKPVEPGDQLILTATLERSFKGIWKFSTVAYVGDTEVTSAEMMVAPETNKSGANKAPAA